MSKNIKKQSVAAIGTGPWNEVWKRLRADRQAMPALLMLAILLGMAIAAPLLANPRPLLEYTPSHGWQMPFLRSFFAPESTEYIIEQLFNYMFLALLLTMPLAKLLKKIPFRRIIMIIILLLLSLPFILTKPKLERVNYRNTTVEVGGFRIMAPLPYGPFEQISTPLAPPGSRHLLGCDELGRDLAVRIIYGSRISLAVGIIATALAMIIGIIVGVTCGFRGGWVDILIMRAVEILMCFPVFLLLLIIMASFQERKFEQSILAVIGVIAITGWIGMAQITRGEVLKQRSMIYIQAAKTAGTPDWAIIFRHILPNIAGTILITFSFSAAGAVLAESSLSFLGFGVQPPTASWGGMLRASFSDPLSSWHLTFFPGLMLFWTVSAFNLLGEGLRKAFDPQKQYSSHQ